MSKLSQKLLPATRACCWKLLQLPSPLPTKALQRYYSILSRFELHEIHDYQDIYFLGRDHQRKLLPRSNYGHDCRLGFYRYVVGDHIGYRYEVLEQLGKVSYAEVFKVYDHKESIIVVLKIGRSLPIFLAGETGNWTFESDVKINVIQMIDHFFPKSRVKGYPSPLCSKVDPLAGHDFGGTRQAKNRARLVISSWKVGLDEVMLIDFGFASYDGQDLLPNVQALNTGRQKYSLGSQKLYSGDNLFTSNSETEQVAALVELLGSPPEELLKVSDPKMKSRNDNLFLDFVRKCLDWNPTLAKPDEALCHPWFIKEIPTPIMTVARPSLVHENQAG
ncbi:Dual specificity tyrosine-phosphorylation-regulated kinase 2 [Orchesella cincta]|uniref:dual-specificity kinase n=1 Tax=Orchesella cincta TaxID=48709 RepID=A0A1D2M9H5_ORCCI|nr:Dual specificity tyrosine-phosphorylation-regulated kinase 2 [Orchesella cincta]